MAEQREKVHFGHDNAYYGIQIGQNLGTVNASIHLPPKQPESPPKPSSSVLSRRDPDYITRNPLVNDVYQKLSKPAARVALYGLGGIGKSQIAIEYSYSMREQSPETWVFWVYASSVARYKQSMRDIADQARVPGRESPGVNIYKLLLDWLRDDRNGSWILILDNADDASFLVKPLASTEGTDNSGQEDGFRRPLFDYLPPCDHGSILITTRGKDVALQLVEDNNIFEVQPMGKKDAQMLLEAKLGSLGKHYDQADIVEIAAALDFIPLAITQAAAMIKQRSPRLSILQYLEKLRTSYNSRSRLLNQEFADTRRDREAKHSITATWAISFEHIQSVRRSAAELLSFMSLCDRHGIPESLLRVPRPTAYNGPGTAKAASPSAITTTSCVGNEDMGSSGDESSEVSYDDGLEDDIVLLRQYSLISDTIDPTLFEMHSLVQYATRQWLDAHGQFEGCKEVYCNSLHVSFTSSNYESWPKCQLLYPHVISAMDLKPEKQTASLKWAEFLAIAADHACNRGALQEAESLAKLSLNVREEALGLENELTLKSMDILASATGLAGRWKEAAELQEQAVERRRGASHVVKLPMLIAKGNLAYWYEKLRRWKEAEELQLEVVEKMQTLRGLDSLETLIAINNLTLLYECQNRMQDVRKLREQALYISEAHLGDKHPTTILLTSNLAVALQHSKQWPEAEDLAQQAIASSKTVLGSDHPNTLSSMANLAATYYNQGRMEEAEKLELQVLDARKKTLGENHPDTLISMENLAVTLKHKGDLSSAIALMEDCIARSIQRLGELHPDTRRRQLMLYGKTSVADDGLTSKS